MKINAFAIFGDAHCLPNARFDSTEDQITKARPPSTIDRARAWAAELFADPKIRRSDIARREKLSRARVTQLLPADASRLAGAFPSEQFYVPPVEVIEVEFNRRHGGLVNVIALESMIQADLYPLTPAEAAWFARRRSLAVAGRQVWFAFRRQLFCTSCDSTAKVAATNTCGIFAGCWRFRKAKSIGTNLSAPALNWD